MSRLFVAGLAATLLIGITSAEAQTNLALNKPVLASSTENAGTPATSAVDGNAGTRWASAFADPQWIRVDLGAPTAITRVTLTWEAAYGKSYRIEGSNDAAAWTTIYSTTTGDGGTDDLTGLAGSYRYVRMYGLLRATGYGYSLWEFQIFGGAAATPTSTARPTATATTPRATATTAPNTVSIQNTAFNPATMTVMVGTTVTWRNNDTINHTSTSNTAVWDSGTLAPGASFSFTFNNAGSFPYHCNVHTGMTGTIVVNAPTPTSTTPPRATATATTARATATSTSRPTATPTTAPSSNISQGKACTASSNLGPCANAFDGNTTGTRWESTQGVDPQWIYVDLGQSASITRVVLTWEPAYAKSYQIQTSPNATTWTTIYTTTTGPGGVETLNITGNGRYVRMYGTVRATGYGYSLWEFQVFGSFGTPTATGTATATTPPTATPTPVPLGNIVPLFDSGTALEPETIIDTPTALITRVVDRVRDRHARESQFNIYEHYISFYWEQRTVTIEVVDKVAKGGTELTFNMTSLVTLNAPNLRTLFQGTGTVAQYMHNVVADTIDPLHYTHTMTYNEKTSAALKIGDRVEIEFSAFLLNQANGRSNYYGTALLYVVGTPGFQPWQGIGTYQVEGVPSPDSFPLPATHLAGGRQTIHINQSNEPLNRFIQIGTNSAPTNGQPFMLGRRLHHTDMGDGTHSGDIGITENPVYTEQLNKLGPHFYARKCIACHVGNGRGIPPAIGAVLTNAVTKVGNASGGPDPNLGGSLQPFSTTGAPEGTVSISSYTTTNGTYGDGTAYSLRKPNYSFAGPVPATFSVRNTPQIVGMGLLEAISESTVAGWADPNDANGDGISGRMQTVVDPQTGQTRLGRFGWKAGQARVKHQIAKALNNDMGVTTSIYPAPDCGSSQSGCGASGVEVNDADLDNWTRYIMVLGVQARQDLVQGVMDSQSAAGETLFTTAKCNACHIPTVTTSNFHPFVELRKETIHPYTDLLLHDMGTGLADNLGEGVATGAEWRTAPLWSIGHTAGVSSGEAYLHDGRARTIEEAILWHGGEAAAAQTAFRNMNATQRAQLVKFLKSI